MNNLVIATKELEKLIAAVNLAVENSENYVERKEAMTLANLSGTAFKYAVEKGYIRTLKHKNARSQLYNRLDCINYVKSKEGPKRRSAPASDD